MGQENYSIYVYDNYLEIWGNLKTDEAIDLINFFSGLGFKSLGLGDQNSTLRMRRLDLDEEFENEIIKDLKEQITDYKESFESECKSHKETAKKLKDVEILMKELMSEEYLKYKYLYEENQKIIRSQMIMQLSQNPEVHKIIGEAGL